MWPPDDRMQLSGLRVWGGKEDPPNETHQGEAPWNTVARVIINGGVHCKIVPSVKCVELGRLLLYTALDFLVQGRESLCKAGECPAIGVSMHPPCGPLSKRSEILDEYLGISSRNMQ